MPNVKVKVVSTSAIHQESVSGTSTTSVTQSSVPSSSQGYESVDNLNVSKAPVADQLKVGLGLCVPLGIIILLLLYLFFHWRHRIRRELKAEDATCTSNATTSANDPGCDAINIDLSAFGIEPSTKGRNKVKDCNRSKWKGRTVDWGSALRQGSVASENSSNGTELHTLTEMLANNAAADKHSRERRRRELQEAYDMTEEGDEEIFGPMGETQWTWQDSETLSNDTTRTIEAKEQVDSTFRALGPHNGSQTIDGSSTKDFAADTVSACRSSPSTIDTAVTALTTQPPRSE